MCRIEALTANSNGWTAKRLDGQSRRASTMRTAAARSGCVFALETATAVLGDPFAQTPLQKIDALAARLLLGERHQKIHEFLSQIAGLDRLVAHTRNDDVDLTRFANFRHDLAAARALLRQRSDG